MGGNTRKPALANAPITPLTEIIKRMYARESESRKDHTTSPMNMWCFRGRAALAPTMRVAIAKKKDMELKNKKYLHDWMTCNRNKRQIDARWEWGGLPPQCLHSQRTQNIPKVVVTIRQKSHLHLLHPHGPACPCTNPPPVSQLRVFLIRSSLLHHASSPLQFEGLLFPTDFQYWLLNVLLCLHIRPSQHLRGQIRRLSAVDGKIDHSGIYRVQVAVVDVSPH